MRILVCGGRDYTDSGAIGRALSLIYDWEAYEPWVLVHGAAPGADSLAGEWGERMAHITVEAYPANWSEHGKAAGPIRNQQMLDTGIDLVVAFPGGRGTADMVGRAKKAGVMVFEVTP